MWLNRLGLAMERGIMEGGTGAILTAGLSSSSVPSQWRQAYFGLTVFSTYTTAGSICSFSLVSSPILSILWPQAHCFSSSLMSIIFSLLSIFGSIALRPGLFLV